MNTINLRQNLNNSDSNIIYPYGKVQSLSFDPDRINVKSCKDVFIYSKDGKEYIDAISGLWNVCLGYGNQHIIESLQSQMDKMCYCSLFDNTNDTVLENARRILELHGTDFCKIGYTCSGSESLELAVKFIRRYWSELGNKERKVILSLEGSYHGTSYGAISLSEEESKIFTAYGPGLSNIVHLPACRKKSCENCNEQACSLACKYVSENGERIAALVLEPILLSLGIDDLSPRYVSMLMEEIQEKEILLVVDEVATGFYRTGSAFCYQRIGIKPDMVCMSKGINSGYLPLGAVVLNEKCNRVLSMGGNEDFLHGSTQCGNILSVAASNVALDCYSQLFSDNHVLRNVEDFVQKLKEKLNNHPLVKEVKQNGNLVLIQLELYGKELELLEIINLRNEIRRFGLITYPAHDGILLLPMYITSRQAFDKMADILGEVFHN